MHYDWSPYKSGDIWTDTSTRRASCTQFVVLCCDSSGQLMHLGNAELGFEPESFDFGACLLSMHRDTSHPDPARGVKRGFAEPTVGGGRP